MSKDNKKTSKADFDAAIKNNEERLKRDHQIVTRYAKSLNPDYFNDDAMQRFIAMDNGRIVEKLPFPDKTHQFQVEIERRFLPTLQGMDDILRISPSRFKKSSHNLHPQRRVNNPRNENG